MLRDGDRLALQALHRGRSAQGFRDPGFLGIGSRSANLGADGTSFADWEWWED
jgi:hypothetical protein